MSFFKNILGNFTSNQFDSDLKKAASLSRRTQFFVHNEIIKSYQLTQKIIENLPAELIYDHLADQANKARENRNQALKAGAKSEKDPLWMSAALAESFYNALRISKPTEFETINNKMKLWLDSIKNALTEDANNLLKTQSECTANLVIACKEHNRNYNCVVITTVFDVIELERKIQTEKSPLYDYQSEVLHMAFSVWLQNANLDDGRASCLPIEYYNLLAHDLHNLAKNKDSMIYCPECLGIVKDVVFDTKSHTTSAHHFSWVERWKCAKGHILYDEKHQASISRTQDALASSQPKSN